MATSSKVQPPKGSRDFLPIDVRHREYATSIIRRVYESYGFEPLQTPTFERLETLLGKYGEEGDQLLFKILLRGQPLVDGIRKAGEHIQQEGALLHGRSGETAPRAEPMLADLGLRYDQTVPLARVYAAHQGKLPAVFRCYQIQPVWRADTPGKGRFREFYQCDMDMVGSASRLAETEVLTAACQCFEQLGFNEFHIRINHRSLLKAVIRLSGIDDLLETDAIVAMDKIDKIGVEGVERELASRNIGPDSRKALLQIVGGDPNLSDIEAKVRDSELGAQAVEDLKTIFELCEVTEAANHLRFDISLARGLSYYTGPIYEAAVPKLGISMGGGGRYDNLIGMFMNKSVPACGFSLGLERILVLMEERGLFPDSLGHIDIVIGTVQPAELPMAMKLSALLRSKGYRVEVVPKAIKPGKLRKYADQRQVSFALWLEPGADEKACLWSRADGVVQTDLTSEHVLDSIEAKR